MELNNDLIAAINYACEKAGSQSAFADLVGTKRQNLSRYLNKEVKDITPKIMARLWPHIREFMPKDFAFPPNFGSETSAEILSNRRKNNKAIQQENFIIREERINKNL